MDRRRFIVGGAGLATAAALGGCKSKEEPAPAAGIPPGEAASAESTYVIIPKMLNNPVFTLAKRGAEKAAREIGSGIKVEYQGSPTGVASEQVDVIRQMIQRKVQGMSISVIDANAVREVIDEAVDQGIPVICFDSDCPDSRRRTFTAADNKAMGRELVTRLIESVGGPENMDGEIAVLSGQASAPNLQERETAAKEELARHTRIKVLPTLYCEDKEDKAIEQIRVTVEAHPELRGWVMVGGWALFRPNALDSVRNFKRTQIVSVDALPPQLDYVRNGQVYCLVAQRCFGWGEESVKILHRLRTEPAWNPPPFTDAGYDLVLKSPTEEQRQAAGTTKIYSVDEYRRQWDEWNSTA